MIKTIKNKQGNEILQTLVIVAVLGFLAIAITSAISTSLKNTSSNKLDGQEDALDKAVNDAKS